MFKEKRRRARATEKHERYSGVFFVNLELMCRLQVSLPMLRELKQINELIFPLKSFRAIEVN